MNPDRFFPWIQKIHPDRRSNILRLKGIIAFAGDAERYVVAGRSHDHRRRSPAPVERREKRESSLVFIGPRSRPREDRAHLQGVRSPGMIPDKS
ncbi:hypothetical protein F2981_03555 [Sinorhizobium meliloti]|nr:hypothetical protein [Sinorhizobium meliloti]